MALINLDEDDKATLEAEDETIRAAERPKEEQPAIPTGTELQRLIEEAINGTPTPVQRDREG